MAAIGSRCSLAGVRAPARARAPSPSSTSSPTSCALKYWTRSGDDRARPARATASSGCSRSRARGSARRPRWGGAPGRPGSSASAPGRRPSCEQPNWCGNACTPSIARARRRPARRARRAAMRSAALFTQPTVLTIQISLRMPTRPSARRKPSNVAARPAPREPGAGGRRASLGSKSSRSVLARLWLCTCSPGAMSRAGDADRVAVLEHGLAGARSTRSRDLVAGRDVAGDGDAVDHGAAGDHLQGHDDVVLLGDVERRLAHGCRFLGEITLFEVSVGDPGGSTLGPIPSDRELSLTYRTRKGSARRPRPTFPAIPTPGAPRDPDPVPARLARRSARPPPPRARLQHPPRPPPPRPRRAPAPATASP